MAHSLFRNTRTTRPDLWTATIDRVSIFLPKEDETIVQIGAGKFHLNLTVGGILEQEISPETERLDLKEIGQNACLADAMILLQLLGLNQWQSRDDRASRMWAFTALLKLTENTVLILLNPPSSKWPTPMLTVQTFLNPREAFSHRLSTLNGEHVSFIWEDYRSWRLQALVSTPNSDWNIIERIWTQFQVDIQGLECTGYFAWSYELMVLEGPEPQLSNEISKLQCIDDRAVSKRRLIVVDTSQIAWLSLRTRRTPITIRTFASAFAGDPDAGGTLTRLRIMVSDKHASVFMAYHNASCTGVHAIQQMEANFSGCDTAVVELPATGNQALADDQFEVI